MHRPGEFNGSPNRGEPIKDAKPPKPPTAFDLAKLERKPFGQFAGQTIDKIAESDDGLRHLDWLVGWFRGKPLLYPKFQQALRVYLADPAIKNDIERLIK